MVATGEVVAKVALSNSMDVNAAVSAGLTAFESWSSLTVKQRAGVMFKVSTNTFSLSLCIKFVSISYYASIPIVSFIGGSAQ